MYSPARIFPPCPAGGPSPSPDNEGPDASGWWSQGTRKPRGARPERTPASWAGGDNRPRWVGCPGPAPPLTCSQVRRLGVQGWGVTPHLCAQSQPKGHQRGHRLPDTELQICTRSGEQGCNALAAALGPLGGGAQIQGNSSQLSAPRIPPATRGHPQVPPEAGDSGRSAGAEPDPEGRRSAACAHSRHCLLRFVIIKIDRKTSWHICPFPVRGRGLHGTAVAGPARTPRGNVSPWAGTEPGTR